MEGYGLVTGLIDSPTPRLPRLSDVLFANPSRGFDSLAALPSNVQAIEAALLFAGLKAPFVAVVGPSGWGKSHLLEAIAKRLSHELRSPIEVAEAATWEMYCARRDPHQPLLLDNVQSVLDKVRPKISLRMHLERRIKSHRPTLLSFTSNTPTRQIRAFLPRQKDWIVCGIQPPTPSEKEHVVRHMCKAEGLFLADSLIWLIAHKISGDGWTLSGAINNLRLQQSHWMDPRMTILACGVLNPYFTDNGSWDLREHVTSCAERFLPNDPQLRTQLALYTLLRVAALNEEDVARYFEMAGGAAYGAAYRFEETVANNVENGGKQDVARFLRYVVDSLRTA